MELRKIVSLNEELFLASSCKAQLARLEADFNDAGGEIWRPLTQGLTKEMSKHTSF
jgi:hypothetical protein